MGLVAGWCSLHQPNSKDQSILPPEGEHGLSKFILKTRILPKKWKAWISELLYTDIMGCVIGIINYD